MFLCLRRGGPFVDGREVVNKVIFPLRRYTFIQPHIYILQPMLKHEWSSRQKWPRLNGMVECLRYIFSHSIRFIKVQHFLLCEEETWELVPRLLSHSISWSAPSSRETLTEIRSGCLALGTTRPGPQWTVFSSFHGDPFGRGIYIDIYWYNIADSVTFVLIDWILNSTLLTLKLCLLIGFY